MHRSVKNIPLGKESDLAFTSDVIREAKIGKKDTAHSYHDDLL
jgi:hypothetical protein